MCVLLVECCELAIDNEPNKKYQMFYIFLQTGIYQIAPHLLPLFILSYSGRTFACSTKITRRNCKIEGDHGCYPYNFWLLVYDAIKHGSIQKLFREILCLMKTVVVISSEMCQILTRMRGVIHQKHHSKHI